MTTRTLRQLHHLALCTLRRTLAHQDHRSRANARHRPGCGDRVLTQRPWARDPGQR
ncbi:hypothetical protein ACIOHR_37635 [Streptomyces anulatus]